MDYLQGRMFRIVKSLAYYSYFNGSYVSGLFNFLLVAEFDKLVHFWTGPQCVLSCAKENRALPKQGFTCCLAMDGVKVLASGFDVDEKVLCLCYMHICSFL